MLNLGEFGNILNCTKSSKTNEEQVNGLVDGQVNRYY